MTSILTYRNRAVYTKDIDFIKRLIENNPNYGRCALSREICRTWNWVQPNGLLKDMICRGLLLVLKRQGYICLPPRKSTPPNPFSNRKKPKQIKVSTISLQSELKDILPLTIKQVRRTDHEELFNSLIDQYHYLRYTRPVGEHLKYIAFSKNRPLACITFSSAARHLCCRDSFIGWDTEARELNLHFLAYNNRFLILPWIRVPFLASHLLSRCARIATSDWLQIYNHPLYWLETIIDTTRFKGTCYKAANWLLLGKTSGRGLNAKTHKICRSIKSVYGYPLVADFREKLRAV